MSRVAYAFFGIISVFLIGQAIAPVSGWSGPSSGRLSAFGIPLTVAETSDQHLTFAYNLNTEMATTVTTGTGAAVVTPPFAVLSGGASGTAALRSNRSSRYTVSAQSSGGTPVVQAAITWGELQ